jgi:putative membrane protein (TIGR04086 family)
MSEVTVMVVLLAVIGAYRYLIAPGSPAGAYQHFDDLAAYYVTTATAGVAVFLGALWVSRRLTSSFVVNGALVGATAVVLTVGFVFMAKPEDRLMYVVSFALRILGGYLGGLTAQRSSTRHTAQAVSH